MNTDNFNQYQDYKYRNSIADIKLEDPSFNPQNSATDFNGSGLILIVAGIVLYKYFSN